MPLKADLKVACQQVQKFISVQRKRVLEVCFLRFALEYVSTSSFIVSTGIRFSTIPDAKPPSAGGSALIAIPQPPTTITALFNPMLGHLSGAYSARVSTDLALSSRFDFNVYSYESEWTMGAEYWLRRDHDPEILPSLLSDTSKKQIHGVVKARASTSNVGVLFYYCVVY